MAASRSNGGPRVTLANGRLAAVSTTVTRIRRTTQPGAATTAPTTAGAPAATSTPPASATTPTAIAGATSGTTARFTTGDRIASRPNDTRTIGSVAAWAASDTPRLSASQRGTRPFPSRPIHSVSGVAQAMRPGGGQRRQLEPSVADEGRIGDEQESRSPAERRRGSPGASGLAGEQRDPGHQRRADDGRRRPGERDVGDDRHDGHDRPASPPETTGQRRDRGSDDRDVPARDRDHVADAGGREGGGKIPVDPVAKADQDPGREACLRFREDAGQRLARAAAEHLEAMPQVVGCRPGPSASAR